MSEYEATPGAAGPEQVGLRFLSVAYRVREKVDQHMTAAGLSLSRAKVLRLLAERGTLHQAELAELLGQAPRSVSQTVEALERAGLIARTTAPEDRRRKTVSVSAEGRAALVSGERAGTRILRELFGSLDTPRLSELDALVALVDPDPTGG
ncbi:MarR family transcriptional regulator [Streptomyces sp. SID3212]|uniref:MarR family winged helix-turn-helix transcriptional regulator n=1 Tax=Streptomyces sp. SID3212 TaxID=2690259 RepID=UPI0019290726|nr:MarR family transcriptional regulator [Streptomyces sp. SID3212]